MMLSYVAYFGGTITILTVMGYWKEVEAFLDNNSMFGIIISIVYFFGAYIFYDSTEKVAKLQFDKERSKGNNGNTLGHRK